MLVQILSGTFINPEHVSLMVFDKDNKTLTISGNGFKDIVLENKTHEDLIMAKLFINDMSLLIARGDPIRFEGPILDPSIEEKNEL